MREDLIMEIKSPSAYLSAFGSIVDVLHGEFILGKRTNRKNGFTLSELLVTISIIGGLMAILLPSMQRVRKQAKTIACHSVYVRHTDILSACVSGSQLYGL